MIRSTVGCFAMLGLSISACTGTVDEATWAEQNQDALSDGLFGHYVHVPLPDTCQEFEHLTLRADGGFTSLRADGVHEFGFYEATDDTLTLATQDGERAYGLESADGAIQLTRDECAEVLSLSDEPECTQNDECGEGMRCDQGACVTKPIGRPVESSDPTPCAERTGGAVVTFDVHGEPLRVWSTNLAFIDEARTLIGHEGFQRTPVFNTMRVGQDDCTGRAWSVNPEDMHFNDLTTEVCDAVPSYIDDNLSDWLVAPAQYCPWGPRVVAVEALR